jgi:hypothetical protein
MTRVARPCPFPDDSGLPTWDQRVLALLPPSVDMTQIREDLGLSPTQRLEKLQDLVDQISQLRRGAG